MYIELLNFISDFEILLTILSAYFSLYFIFSNFSLIWGLNSKEIEFKPVHIITNILISVFILIFPFVLFEINGFNYNDKLFYLSGGLFVIFIIQYFIFEHYFMYRKKLIMENFILEKIFQKQKSLLVSIDIKNENNLKEFINNSFNKETKISLIKKQKFEKFELYNYLIKLNLKSFITNYNYFFISILFILYSIYFFYDLINLGSSIALNVVLILLIFGLMSLIFFRRGLIREETLTTLLETKNNFKLVWKKLRNKK